MSERPEDQHIPQLDHTEEVTPPVEEQDRLAPPRRDPVIGGPVSGHTFEIPGLPAGDTAKVEQQQTDTKPRLPQVERHTLSDPLQAQVVLEELKGFFRSESAKTLAKKVTKRDPNYNPRAYARYVRRAEAFLNHNKNIEAFEAAIKEGKSVELGLVRDENGKIIGFGGATIDMSSGVPQVGETYFAVANGEQGTKGIAKALARNGMERLQELGVTEFDASTWTASKRTLVQAGVPFEVKEDLNGSQKVLIKLHPKQPETSPTVSPKTETTTSTRPEDPEQAISIAAAKLITMSTEDVRRTIGHTEAGRQLLNGEITPEKAARMLYEEKTAKNKAESVNMTDQTTIDPTVFVEGIGSGNRKIQNNKGETLIVKDDGNHIRISTEDGSAYFDITNDEGTVYIKTRLAKDIGEGKTQRDERMPRYGDLMETVGKVFAERGQPITEIMGDWREKIDGQENTNQKAFLTFVGEQIGRPDLTIKELEQIQSTIPPEILAAAARATPTGKVAARSQLTKTNIDISQGRVSVIFKADNKKSDRDDTFDDDPPPTPPAPPTPPSGSGTGGAGALEPVDTTSSESIQDAQRSVEELASERRSLLGDQLEAAYRAGNAEQIKALMQRSAELGKIIEARANQTPSIDASPQTQTDIPKTAEQLEREKQELIQKLKTIAITNPRFISAMGRLASLETEITAAQRRELRQATAEALSAEGLPVPTSETISQGLAEILPQEVVETVMDQPIEDGDFSDEEIARAAETLTTDSPQIEPVKSSGFFGAGVIGKAREALQRRLETMTPEYRFQTIASRAEIAQNRIEALNEQISALQEQRSQIAQSSNNSIAAQRPFSSQIQNLAQELEQLQKDLEIDQKTLRSLAPRIQDRRNRGITTPTLGGETRRAVSSAEQAINNQARLDEIDRGINTTDSTDYAAMNVDEMARGYGIDPATLSPEDRARLADRYRMINGDTWERTELSQADDERRAEEASANAEANTQAAHVGNAARRAGEAVRNGVSALGEAIVDAFTPPPPVQSESSTADISDVGTVENDSPEQVEQGRESTEELDEGWEIDDDIDSEDDDPELIDEGLGDGVNSEGATESQPPIVSSDGSPETKPQSRKNGQRQDNRPGREENFDERMDRFRAEDEATAAKQRELERRLAEAQKNRDEAQARAEQERIRKELEQLERDRARSEAARRNLEQAYRDSLQSPERTEDTQRPDSTRINDRRRPGGPGTFRGRVGRVRSDAEAAREGYENSAQHGQRRRGGDKEGAGRARVLTDAALKSPKRFARTAAPEDQKDLEQMGKIGRENLRTGQDPASLRRQAEQEAEERRRRGET